VRQLVQLLIDEADGDVTHAIESTTRSERSSPTAFVDLEGPQTPENALQQDDVDDLLASLGF